MERIVDIPDDIDRLPYAKATSESILCGLTVREEIVRCRDCMKSREKGWKCTRFTEEVYNEENEIGELVMANVRPDGFCAWGERRD